MATGYKRPPPNTAWKPGQSGNPGGRPKALVEIRELARSAAPECIERLIQIMRTAKPETACVAARELLDRGYGKPTQPIAGDDSLPPIRLNANEVSEEYLVEIIARQVGDGDKPA